MNDSIIAELPNGDELEFPAGTSDDVIQMAVKKHLGAPEQSYGMGLANAGLQGMTFGFSDEIGTGLAALAASVGSDEKFDDIYSSMMTSEKSKRKSFSDQNPGAALAAEAAGGLATGLAGAGKVLGSNALRMASPAARTLATAGVGAAEGGIYGAGQADPGSRISGAAQGAAIGAVAAPVGGAVMNTLGKGLSRGASAIKQRVGEGSSAQADRAMRAFSQAGGLSADDIQSRMAKLGPEGTLMDTDDSLRMLTKAATAKTGPVKQQARDVVNRRQTGQIGRLERKIENLLGKNAGSYADDLKTVVEQRAAQSAPLYQKAFGMQLKRTPKLKSVIGRLPDGTMKAAKKLMKQEGAGEFGDSFGLMRQMHYARMELGDRIGKAVRSGEPNSARIMMGVKRDLDKVLADQNPAYLEATKVYSDASNLASALDMGKSFLSKDFDELALKVADMTDLERDMFRSGAIKAMADRFDKIGSNTDAVSRLTKQRGMQKRLAMLFDDPSQARSFAQKIDAEDQFTRSRRVIDQQSITADLQEAMRSLDSSSDPSMLARLAMGEPTAFVSLISKALGKSSVSPETLGVIGDRMLDKGIDPQEIQRIFGSRPIREALGPEWDRVVAPYVRSISAPIAVGMSDS